MNELAELLASVECVYINASPEAREIFKSIVAAATGAVQNNSFSDTLHVETPVLRPYKYH